MKRIWHDYRKWEEIPAGMWEPYDTTRLQEAIDFTGDHILYGSWMFKVVNEWKYSCENHLSGTRPGKQSWIGHAAAAMALRLPESVTRKAWGFLTKEQQDLANNEADKAIRIWTEKYDNTLKNGKKDVTPGDCQMMLRGL